MDLGLLQKEVAEKIGVNEASVYNWEKNLKGPALRFIPKVIEFLGYVPAEFKPGTVAQRIVTYRRLLGLSQKELARRLRVDQSTLGRWEKGKGRPSSRVFEIIKSFGSWLDTT
jgi:transcriptional regulator with XRE-family HTH domain